MGKTVYMYRPFVHTKTLLEKAGFNVLSGDGHTLDQDALNNCDGFVAGKAVIGEKELENVKNLKLIVKPGIGLDTIDLESCKAHGITVTNTPEASFNAVAEHAVALLMALAKNLQQVSRSFHNDHPDWQGSHLFRACELKSKTLGLIGFGRIGQRVAHLVSGFDMDILVYDPYVTVKDNPGITQVNELSELLKKADFVSLHVNGDKTNTHLIGEKELSLLKPSAFLINTTRGHVIDEKALTKHLKEGKLRGAALDVYEKEPVSSDNELLTMDNVITTPHMAASTNEASERTQQLAAEKIITFFNKQ